MQEAGAQAQQKAALAEKTDAEILEELGLPDPDTLSEGDDFAVFMTHAVPDRIRHRALRRLGAAIRCWPMSMGWSIMARITPMRHSVLGNLKTAYQVGKGMTHHVEEMARQAEAEAEQPRPAKSLWRLKTKPRPHLKSLRKTRCQRMI